MPIKPVETRRMIIEPRIWIKGTSLMAMRVNMAIEEVNGKKERNCMVGLLMSVEFMADEVITKPTAKIIWTSRRAEDISSTLETVEPIAPKRTE